MRPPLYIIIVILFTNLLNAQSKIRKIDVEESGFEISTEFDPILNEQQLDKIGIKITPISGSDLDSWFSHQGQNNGEFYYYHLDKSRNEYFLSKKNRKREKSDYEFFLEGIDWLLDNDKISTQEFNLLQEQISSNYENTPKVTAAYQDSRSNPYYLNGKYLSIFEIEISNPTNVFKPLEITPFVESGTTLTEPFSTQQIINMQMQSGSYNQNQNLNLSRFNLPPRLTIPPNSTIVKYFATAPIEYEDELKISIEGINNKYKWKVNLDYTSIANNYSFYECQLKWYFDGSISPGDQNFLVLNGSDGNIFLNEEEIFIEEQYLDEEFELITLSIYLDRLFFSRGTYTGRDLIDLQNNRRKILRIKASKLSQLKKKVKI